VHYCTKYYIRNENTTKCTL